jgi:hypothetical protein
MWGKYWYNKPSLFSGVQFLKNPANSKIVMHEIKTLCVGWLVGSLFYNAFSLRRLSSEISSSHGCEYDVQVVIWDILPCKIIVGRRHL